MVNESDYGVVGDVGVFQLEYGAVRLVAESALDGDAGKGAVLLLWVCARFEVSGRWSDGGKRSH